MRATKPSTIEELQLTDRFENLRQTLLSGEYSEHLGKPLAYWAVSTDRRLPLALLGRKLGDLVNTSFRELSSTPGIGHKKIVSFVELLGRAAETDPAELDQVKRVAAHRPIGADGNGNGHSVDRTDDPAKADDDGFDPGSVSEVVWAQWQATVVKHNLGGEALGRFAPSLRDMTRVIWNTPLREYIDCTLAEMRARKTHGEKRVRAIMQVFHGVHALAGQMGTQPHLVVRIFPRHIDHVQRWIGRALQSPGIPSEAELTRHFVQPLLEQVRNDSTRQIATLAENRLGLAGPITSVRQVARTMGLTRARVYQLLNEINDIVNVRWPDGRHQAYELRARIEAELPGATNPPDLTQFNAAIELFYPGNRRGAAGPVENAFGEEAREPELLMPT